MFTQSIEMSPTSGANALWSDSPTPDLMLEVDFKWLMAGQGCWVDSQRLHTDPGYAHDCLESANHSPCDALRICAHDLQRTLEPEVR